MYLPKSKYKKSFTEGGEFLTPDGEPYRGPYIKTTIGKNYIGTSINDIETELININSSNPVQIEKPYFEYREPTEDEIKVGYFHRYFIQDRKTLSIWEVGFDQFNRLEEQSKYIGTVLPWMLRDNRLTKEEVGEMNRQTVSVVEQYKENDRIKGLSQMITDYTKHVVG